MKKLFTISLLAALTTGALASSETKKQLKMSEQGQVSEASLRFGANAVLTAATVSNPFFGFWVYLCVTQKGPGLNDDLDFLTYDQKYGLLYNTFDGLKNISDSDIGGSATDASKSVVDGISSSAQKTARLILSERDSFYADGEATPERTPELHKVATEVSTITGDDLNNSAEDVILTIEQNTDLL